MRQYLNLAIWLQHRAKVQEGICERTLYSASSREIAKKGRAARFKKASIRKFGLRGEG